ncbi:MAG: YciL protein [uncultured Thiotrichaceae bacterium]|uniref:YciL protein n=1 Tax=uncultured Thiotrichaceae bacterium TaxID=298394 RepID=A0A6S6SLS8_9GAMM|nr:MAG: YciL protein [uncultured Thiotrichaceae bacterium]
MLYTIVAEDVEDSLDKRLAARPAHLDRLHKLRDEGRLIVAGPNPLVDSEDPGSAGFSGSVIIAEFDSLQTAQKWAEADPYLNAGVYKTVSVKPFKKVLP